MTKAALTAFLSKLPDDAMIFVHSVDDYLIGLSISVVEAELNEPAFAVIEGRKYPE